MVIDGETSRITCNINGKTFFARKSLITNVLLLLKKKIMIKDLLGKIEWNG